MGLLFQTSSPSWPEVELQLQTSPMPLAHAPSPGWGFRSRRPHTLDPERGPRSKRPFPLQTPTPDVRPKARGRGHAGANPAARIACTRFRAFRCRRPHILGPERGGVHAFFLSSLLSGAPAPDVLALLALSGAPALDILHAPGPEWCSQSRSSHTPGSEWGFRS